MGNMKTPHVFRLNKTILSETAACIVELLGN